MAKGWVLVKKNEYPVWSDFILTSEQDDIVHCEVLSYSLNHRDLWIAKGMYAGIQEGIVLGSDACVMYEGDEYILFPSLNWGDNESYQSKQFEVLGMPSHGTFAETIAIHKRHLFPKPSHLSINEAAALPLAGLTAYRALFTKANIQPKENVLITGVGGGVATFALQMAVAHHCNVYVTSSNKAKREKAIALGAVGAFDYTDATWIEQCRSHKIGFDVIIDGAGGEGFAGLTKVANPGCRIVVYGSTAGAINGTQLQPVFWKQLVIYGSTMGTETDFVQMLSFVNEHKIVPIVDTVFAKSELPQAFDYLNDSAQMGKVVLA